MLGTIIPVIDAIKANKRLKEKIAKQEFIIPEYIDDIDIKCLEDDYKSAVEAKNRFEDKAKTIIAALTISITLILNLSKIIETISDKYDYYLVDILIFILAVLAIIYMLIAGIMSIQVLIKENILHSIPLSERTKKDKKSIYIKTQLNVNQNLIRNNIIFSAYESIRNSVICLIVIFILTIIPYSNKNDDSAIQLNQVSYDNICFGGGAVVWLSENKNDKELFDNVIAIYNKDNKGKTRHIYDMENDILVSITQKEDVYVIDEIITDIEGIE